MFGAVGILKNNQKPAQPNEPDFAKPLDEVKKDKDGEPIEAPF